MRAQATTAAAARIQLPRTTLSQLRTFIRDGSKWRWMRRRPNMRLEVSGRRALDQSTQDPHRADTSRQRHAGVFPVASVRLIARTDTSKAVLGLREALSWLERLAVGGPDDRTAHAAQGAAR